MYAALLVDPGHGHILPLHTQTFYKDVERVIINRTKGSMGAQV